MNKEQRERKGRLRSEWKASQHLHGLSYPAWLECQLDGVRKNVSHLNRRAFRDNQRIEAFKEYIMDFEAGMRIVEKCAMGTIGLRTSIPAMKKEDDREAVVAAVVSLYRMLQDAKRRVADVSYSDNG